MRLTQYLNEGIALSSFSDFDEVVKILNSQCSQILKAYRQAGFPLYRGSKKVNIGHTIDFVEVKSHIEDRTPRDMDPAMHKELNNAFKNYFGWSVRNGVSTTTYVQQAETYGVVSYFFAPNGFKFVYSLKIADLWQEVKKFLFGAFGEDDKFLGFDWIDNGRVIKPDEFMKTYYTDKNLVTAIKKSKGEIMFNTPNYYLLRFQANQENARAILDALKIKSKVKYY